ncbi:hypothetical protein DPEC_G00347640 [Dallia pectoralis]|uniref:Uncharacterized protein n=1 Tax=Dallia pectoralis TaxID=75939 RepID=A0ACC2F489_DALPE|nr:hypothetical protein DPEC_G00347640 [Dallia pectoralis]
MEKKNANPHRYVGETILCATIAGEMGDIPVGGMKGATDACTSSARSPSSTGSSSTLVSCTTNAVPSVGILEPHPVHEENIQSSGWSEEASPNASGDPLSNGLGPALHQSTGNNQGATAELVNNRTDGESEARSTLGQAEGSSSLDPVKPDKPTHLCPTGHVQCGVGMDHAPSEGLGSGSDPSIDSLESFLNLNSCPSSDLTSGDGVEDRGLSQALQSQYGPDGTTVPGTKDRCPGQSMYHIKWIRWKEENTPIITQNENGPCPLLAIMNVLLLAWKVKMPPMMEIITAEQLMEYLGDYILDAKPKEISEAQRLNYEQNMSDAMAVLHKLQTGLDVNVRFTGVRVFEYTPECIVFDLLDIPLYHGWLVDPQMGDTVKAVGNCSYNQLVEKIISCKQSVSSELAGEGFVAEQFLHSTATQLTYHGLCELTSTVQEGELCVFFRNNHFSTMTKFKGQLYLLVTDQGFLTEEKVVWESLHNVDGDGNFCDSEFRLRPPSDPETVYHGQQDQIDQVQIFPITLTQDTLIHSELDSHPLRTRLSSTQTLRQDYQMALSLQQEQQNPDLLWEALPEGISDLELAKKLQEEEDRRASQYYQEQEQAAAAQAQQGQPQPAEGADETARGTPPGAAATSPAAGGSPSPGKQPSAGERKAKKEVRDKDKCVIL